MKPLLSKMLMICLLSGIGFTDIAYGQTSVNKAALYSSAAKEINDNNANKPVLVNIKVKRSFLHMFGEVASVSWSVAGQNFLSQFYANGLRTNALFSKDGNMIYTIKYGTASLLPGNLKELVDEDYPAYNISMVSEIEQQNRHIWVVQLQNNKKVITARIENEVLEQVQEFKKSI